MWSWGCRDGKEVVVVGVTSGRASAGARAGKERGDLRVHGTATGRKSLREMSQGKSVGMGKGPVRARCADRKGSGVGMGKSPLRGQERVWCEDREGSGVRMGKGPLWGQRMLRCGDVERSGEGMGRGLV